MSAISVCHELVNERSLACCSPFFAVFDGCHDREDVHAVDFETGDVLAALVVFGQCGRTICCCAHSVFVVYYPLVSLYLVRQGV